MMTRRAVSIDRPGADFKVVGQTVFRDDQGVVAGGGHRRSESAKDGLAVVLDLAGLAVHQIFRPNHPAAECRADRLVAKTDAEQWQLAGKMPDQFNADPGFLRSARPGGNHDAFRTHCLDFFDGHFVVAPDFDLCAQFAKILDKVVSEGIVVIEYEDHNFIVVREPGFQGFKVSMFQGLRSENRHRAYLTDLPPIAMLTPTLEPCLFGAVQMAETQQDQENDKRATRRFALRLPVTVRYGENEEEHAAQTRDVSARGICFSVDTAIQAGSPIDFTMTLPPEITLTESIRVRCQGRVVRVEGGGSAQKMMVAAVIDEYEFLAE